MSLTCTCLSFDDPAACNILQTSIHLLCAYLGLVFVDWIYPPPLPEKHTLYRTRRAKPSRTEGKKLKPSKPGVVFRDYNRILQGWKSCSLAMGSVRDKESSFFYFPHTSLIPGLQFSMAGIVGRPEEFFLVPSVRFFYETFSYL